MNTVRIVLLGMCMLMLAGCSRKYVITTTNGNRITTQGKPKLKQSVYIFKDSEGRESFVSAGRVREIAPASMSQEPSKLFVPSGGR